VEKVLPKFHGTEEELEESLRMLLGFAREAHADFKTLSWEDIRNSWRLDSTGRLTSVDQGELGNFRLPRLAAKVWRMLH
jgi:hypothetical protein